VSGDVRANWRQIDVVDLTDAEVDQMTDAESRWCSDLLVKRHLARMAPPPVEQDQPPDPEPLDFDKPGIAVMDTGIRILLYPGEHEVEGAFAGEKLPPLTSREIASNSYVSCLWDRSKVLRIEPAPSPSAGS
jgi:hypothetical protein